jgi:hypothetical protein
MGLYQGTKLRKALIKRPAHVFSYQGAKVTRQNDIIPLPVGVGPR